MVQQITDILFAKTPYIFNYIYDDAGIATQFVSMLYSLFIMVVVSMAIHNIIINCPPFFFV